MKKINIFLPILVILGILNNSSISAGSSCSRMQVTDINLQPESAKFRPFENGTPDEVVVHILSSFDFRTFDGFKALINFGKTSHRHRTLALETIHRQINTMHMIDKMNIDCIDIFDAIAKNDFSEIWNHRHQINSQNPILNNQPPLHFAILKKSSPKIIFLLLLLGAKTNSLNLDANTPLNLISKQPCVETNKFDQKIIILSLLFCGANPNNINRFGQTPIISVINQTTPDFQPVLKQLKLQKVFLLIGACANYFNIKSTQPLNIDSAIGIAQRIEDKEMLSGNIFNQEIWEKIITFLKKAK